jgi:hypothetical protein
LVRPLPQDDENHTTNLLFGTTFSKQPKDVADDPTTKYQTGDTFEHNSCLAQGFSELEIYLIGSQTETLKDSIGNPISVGFKRKINNLPTNKYGFDGGAVDQVNASLVDLLPTEKILTGDDLVVTRFQGFDFFRDVKPQPRLGFFVALVPLALHRGCADGRLVFATCAGFPTIRGGGLWKAERSSRLVRGQWGSARPPMTAGDGMTSGEWERWLSIVRKQYACACGQDRFRGQTRESARDLLVDWVSRR